METEVKYLIDTNIWLERLLDQEKSSIVSSFFNSVPLEYIFISDFTLHSIGVILSRYKRLDIFDKFVKDLFFNAKIEQITLEPHDFKDLILNINKYNLDFDDSYQATLSNKYDLIIVTFDRDFNVQGLKKSSPEEVLKKYSEK